MQMSIILAAGAASAVMAASNAGNASSHAANVPDSVGDYDLIGCALDMLSWANLELVALDEYMDLDLCAASCDAKYFVSRSNECHCGDEITDDLSEFSRDSCYDWDDDDYDDEPCTVYVRPPPVTKTKTEHHVSTITSTITATACPPHFKNCTHTPHITTITTTQTQIITTEVPHKPDWHKKKIVCYGPHCAHENPCEECEKERVVCHDDHCWTEACKAGEEWNTLVIYKGGDDCHYAPGCHDGDCNKKIVCYGGKCATEKCVGDECAKNLVCSGDDCHYAQCDSGACHQKVVCQDGKDCTVVAPCEGDHCPKPAPPTNPSGPVVTAAPVGNNKGNKGNNNGNNGNNGDNKGNNGENKGNNNNKGNNGDNKGNNNGENACHPPHCKPAPGSTASGPSVVGPTHPPMVGGAQRSGVTFFGALAGLAFFL